MQLEREILKQVQHDKMVRNKFIRVCEISEIPDNKRGRKFTLEDDTEIAVFKINGGIHAVLNTCPHNQTHMLYEGKIGDDLYLECPVHGWRFNLETGKTHPECKELSSKLEIFNTKVENGELYVEVKKKKW